MPKKGYKQSEEHRKVNKGKIPFNKGKKGLQVPWNKGKTGVYSTETKKKMSLNKLGKKRKPFTKETLEKMRGRVLSEETKLKLSLSKKGEKNGAWKGGKSFEPYTMDWTGTLRRSIRERDRYTCQICTKQQTDRAFPVHHIDYKKENCNSNNLITLCIPCHSKTNSNRENWIKYFKNKQL